MPKPNFDSFARRHIGPQNDEVQLMLKSLGFMHLDELVSHTIPKNIRAKKPLDLPAAESEAQLLNDLKSMARKNEIFKTYIGMGYSGCITPPVILRNILENPGWYTQYTPYQAEISQGRLEALLNFQTMVVDLSGMEIANASLLDEGTAAAEAMAMAYSINFKKPEQAFFVSKLCHPQTIAVVQTRAESLGIKVIIGDHFNLSPAQPLFGALMQYPATSGAVYNYRAFVDQVHALGGLAVVAADILSLALLVPPSEFGADIVVGSTQRFGVPMGYGGPHAAYLATKDIYKRQLPGRLVGLSKDAEGRSAIRLALQTREQHIRREKATSNICTAQVLLAVVASMYAVYHGPEGIRAIAEKVNLMALTLATGLKRLGYALGDAPFFDTVLLQAGKGKAASLVEAACKQKINLRLMNESEITIAVDETTTFQDLDEIFKALAQGKNVEFKASELAGSLKSGFSTDLSRKSDYLTHPVFNTYHSETEMLRYMNRLQAKDLSLTTSMIPLGSCTMKLNATAEMIPVTWPEFGQLHPFIPKEQAKGYQELIRRLESMLAEITGFKAVSLQPNAGSQGEYAGLLVIRKYHEARGQGNRNVCLIPQSAHGTNPASAAMAGMKVVVVRCDENGNIDLKDLHARAEEHKNDLSALMVTYPSTHGVFEEQITEICDEIHKHGGQVYMDGANMNAQVGLCRPGDFGPDVCHLNLHKTFCIPHGGGGPGMGPIGVAEHLAPFLPTHPVVPMGGAQGIGAISAAPWGSPSILPISYAYIAMMGSEGLTRATQVAILNANYIAKKLDPYFPVLYKGKEGLVAHECIIDLRPLKVSTGIEVEDVAKRLMDYGFHAPTISFPVPGTMMIEPTESESKKELDRFCEAMIAIREEIAEIEKGSADPKNNVLKNAPHTATMVTADEWSRPYSRKKAAFPVGWVRDNKFWPSVARIDAVYGERNLVCSCPPMDEFT